jgi:hypothetical protein
MPCMVTKSSTWHSFLLLHGFCVLFMLSLAHKGGTLWSEHVDATMLRIHGRAVACCFCGASKWLGE